MNDMQQHESSDPESKAFLTLMAEQERMRNNRVPGVRTVLVVLSSAAMVFDVESLRQKIHASYPDAAVFFQTTLGKWIGSQAPHKVDLLIDFTGPRQRQGLFHSRKLRRMARVAVGRNAGLFRKRIYDRIYDEKSKDLNLSSEVLTRERFVQREVLGLAGVVFVQTGDTHPDRGKTIALELPPLARL